MMDVQVDTFQWNSRTVDWKRHCKYVAEIVIVFKSISMCIEIVFDELLRTT